MKAFKNQTGWALEKVTVKDLDPHDRGLRIQLSEVIRIASYDVVATRPGEDHDRGVDDIRGAGSAAEFSAGTRQFSIERNNLDFCAPQKARQCNLSAAVTPGLSHDARWYSKVTAL